MGEVVVDYVGGCMPTQAGGEMFGSRFYFRARHGGWALTVAKPGCNPISGDEAPRIVIEGVDLTNGCMEEGLVLYIIKQAAMILASCEQAHEHGQPFIKMLFDKGDR